ncbi:hypothetical protein BO71DRAFT_326376 [Aspergillus ellipticus CBS 707.79]|uniref:Uncharacterized protein n=1 Tax=Aspergillus ellipticus CBS 707.79 TaxID=1448320 RepID=A0A319D9I2_9EURO|nr:hypothetical protein BO71DRAFT_326376 [Aspergillus ellipticus CBS 707.79]
MAGAYAEPFHADSEAVAGAFVDNHLPAHHSMFDNPPVHYDRATRRYALNTCQESSPGTGNNDCSPPPSQHEPPIRPAYTATKAMTFWAAMFPEAMATLAQSPAPKGRDKTMYDIRNLTDWEDVYETLEAARDHYSSPGGKPRRFLSKFRRRAADGVTPVAQAAQIASTVAPSNAISSPVLAAVVLILNAVQTSATVRQQVLASFDRLQDLFADVELFLNTFREDAYVYRASVDLTVATLTAIECAIDFFTSNEFLRGGKAILLGDKYGKHVLDSLDQIQAKSRALKGEAEKSHMYASHQYQDESRQFRKGVVERDQVALDGINAIHGMMVEHGQRMEHLEWELRKRDEWMYQENRERIIVNGLLYARIPSRQPSPLPWAQVPIVETYVSQGTLRRMLDIPDRDSTDMAAVMDLKRRLPGKERARAEQVLHTAEFHHWLVAAASTKLLPVLVLL